MKSGRKEKEIASIDLDMHTFRILEQKFGDVKQYRLLMDYDSGDCQDSEFSTSIDILYLENLLDLAKFFLKASGRKNLKIK